MVSFRRERFVAKGGPDGGDGGKGGGVYLVADRNVDTLQHFLRKKEHRAESGERGKRNNGTGKSGEDLFLAVPIGTQILEVGRLGEKTREIFVADLTEDGQEFLVAEGGLGGFGNAHFKRATFQTPRFAELGEPGEEKKLILKLKLLADVGIIGFPNAGKSTLLSVISSARPKIADYAFTTLTPNLGIVRVDKESFVAADIPGLIEGASKGKGLGTAFLKHIERTRLLIHLIDAGSGDPRGDFRTVNQEMKRFSRELLLKPQIVVFNKIDVISEDRLEKLKKISFDFPVFFISAVTHAGVKELLYKVASELKKLPPRQETPRTELAGKYKVFTLKDIPIDRFEISKQGGIFVVTGNKLERMVVRTDFQNEQAVGRLYKVMKRMGVWAELRKKGAKEGDKVEIAGKIIEYREV